MTVKTGYYAPPEYLPLTATRKQQYIDALRQHGIERWCAAHIGVSFRTVKAERKADRVFNEYVEDALGAWAEENLIKEAFRRGVTGVQEDVYWNGEVVGQKTVFSDRMLLQLLKAHVPSFRDNAGIQANVSSGGVLLIPAAPATVDDWEDQFGEGK